MSRSRILLSLLALLATSMALAPAAAQGQATRTWIASGLDGDDVNPCSRTAPCKTLFGAYAKTAAGGEINALEPGGYGTLTVTKAITIDLSVAGGRGAVLNSGGISGLTVDAAATDDVVLRGLDIFGGGTFTPVPPCPFSGLRGVLLRNARSLRIDDSTIGNQATAGIVVAPEASDPEVLIDGVDLSNVCGRGIDVSPAAGRTANVTVHDTTVFNAGTALFAGAGGNVFLSGSVFASSGTGIDTSGGGTVAAVGENAVAGNDVNGEPTTRSGTAVQPRDGANGI
ncbi:MAG TPA: right-handed parallel beta-helix repeat-containing protein, partial [Solirubrobacteraceae bacterium]|nr:right-handed parallel beta-helix repeat-containing protein [Solirubrobacteraceae bacterium]